MATEWVTVRNPSTGNIARVPRSALPQMPKWREVKPGKKSKASNEPADDEVSTAEPKEI